MSVSKNLGIVMDPIESIKPWKDSSFAMLLEAQQRGWNIFYMRMDDLFMDNSISYANYHIIQLDDDNQDWFTKSDPGICRLDEMDIILMRKDPPFDMEYVYTTYLLERAELAGTLIVNRPASLRDINEKAFTAWFPECCPETLITRRMEDLRKFRDQHGKIVVKPLDGMGGKSIFVVAKGDNNANVIFETLTDNGNCFMMAQRHIPEITAGDKRIILIDGQAPEYALARIPDANDNRGNLVMGAQAEVRKLSDRDRWICEQVGPELSRRGVIFAGLDVIGDYLTEINVTSPTGIREISKLAGVNLAEKLFDHIEQELSARQSAA
jgi:glutathione synthase